MDSCAQQACQWFIAFSSVIHSCRILARSSCNIYTGKKELDRKTSWARRGNTVEDELAEERIGSGKL